MKSNRIVAIAIAALFSVPAFATQPYTQSPSTSSTASVSNRIDNDVRAAATAFVASNNSNSNSNENRNSAYGGYGGTAVSAGGTGGTGGAAQSNNALSIQYPNQVAGFALGSLYPSAPCMGTSNIGGGNAFFNFGAGSSWESEECNIRETARSFSGLDLKADALAILCSSKYAAAAPSCAAAKTNKPTE